MDGNEDVAIEPHISMWHHHYKVDPCLSHHHMAQMQKMTAESN